MPQPTPPISLPLTRINYSAPDSSVSGVSRDIRRSEQLRALETAVGQTLTVVALLGSDTGEQSEWGSVTFLAREEVSGALVVAALNERVGMSAGYDVTLWRTLEESLPGPVSWCPQCGA